MTLHPAESILIVDFGSQVTQLIARRVREAGVYSEIAPFNRADEAFARLQGRVRRTSRNEGMRVGPVRRAGAARGTGALAGRALRGA